MPSKFRLRYIFRPIIRQLAKILVRVGISPNIATSIMLGFSILSFVSLVVFRNLLFFSIFVFFTGIFDGVDGAIARLTMKTTKFGGFFDSFMDRVSEFFIFIALMLYTWTDLLFDFISMPLIVSVSFFFSIMISYSKARGEVLKEGDYDIGIFARSERLFYLVVSSIVSLFLPLLNILLLIFMILIILTAFYRIYVIFKNLN